jgi:putative nucleotidyltransferase with HDIG domain
MRVRNVPRQQICLHGVGPQIQDKTWESSQCLRIGRSPHVEVSLTDSSVSRRHAEITVSEEGWVVRDLGSRNGTFLNGIRVGQVERRLQEHDLLQCGNLVWRIGALKEFGPGDSGILAGDWQIEAMSPPSWEEALQVMAMDLTRHTRPGEQLLALLRAGQQLHQTTSIDELLHLNLRDVAVALDAQRGCILLVDENSGKLQIRAVHAAATVSDGARCYSSTMAQRCFQRRESLLCNDVRDDPELMRARSVDRGAMRSILCALLHTSRKRLGVLHLDRGPAQKPFTSDDLRLADGLAAAMSSSVARARILEEKQRNVFLQTVLALTQSLELRDPQTSLHAQHVTDYVLLLADELRLPPAERDLLQMAAPLHDIGKLAVPDYILHKTGPLTSEEFEQMKSHTTRGANLLQNIPDLIPVVPIVRSHHERWDGLGYPDGLAGEDIPRLARMISVADAFDALTSDRPYRRALGVNDALAEIQDHAGSQFDAECVEAFCQLQPRLSHLVGDHDPYGHIAEMIVA